MLVLEKEEHALARGAKIYCELAGYGSSGDAELVRPGEEDPAALCHLASARFGEFGVYDLAVEDNLSETR